MTFEPKQILKNVLDFYGGAGTAAQADELVRVEGASPLVRGNPAAYEQLLFMVFGYLLPDFGPLRIVWSVERLPDGPQTLDTLITLPPASATSLDQLRSAIFGDKRLLRVLGHNRSGIRELPAACNCRICFGFGLDSADGAQEIPPIDFAELAKRFEEADLAFGLLEGFVANARRHLLLLISAADTLDWNEAFRHAHSLKGGALNVCAAPFATKAKAVETTIKSGDHGAVPALIAELDNACAELEAAWKSHRESEHG